MRPLRYVFRDLFLGALLAITFFSLMAATYNYFSPGGNLAANYTTCPSGSTGSCQQIGTINAFSVLSNPTSSAANPIASSAPVLNQTIFNAPHTSTLAQFEPNVFDSLNGISFGTGVKSDSGATGTAQCQADASTRFYTTTFFLNGQGDFTLCSGFTLPQFAMQMKDDTANQVGIFSVQNINGDGPSFGVTTSTTANCNEGAGTTVLPTSAGPCVYFSNDNPQGSDILPLGIIQLGTGFHRHFIAYATTNSLFLAIGDVVPVKFLQATSTGSNQATVTLGDTNATSVTNIKGGSAANTQANGVPIDTGNIGTTGSIGGGALVAGACTSGTVSITGLTTAMDVHPTPSTYPGDGFWWEAYASAAGTATVKVCASIAGTPTASTYNVRVIQ